ncbi:hypothetical protein BGP_1916 [Beggiatoa sp. PS]|nr:hypothetical protein BGP_1916 [Beggiatoa sp. PS]
MDTAHGHNLNCYVGWAKSFSCPPTSLEKFFRQKFRRAKFLPESLFPRFSRTKTGSFYKARSSIKNQLSYNNLDEW